MKTEAILALCPTAQFVNRGGEVEWLSPDISQPTEAEITAKIAELEAAEPMRLLRAARNQRLANTDWWASSDLTMTAAQTAYRQALRAIASPATNTDRTLVLPDEAGTVLTSGTAASSIPGYGNQITDYDEWYLTSTFTGSAYPVSGWTQALSVGGGLTESSGTFSFPSTGYWLIQGSAVASAVEGTRYFRFILMTTTDNSTYASVSEEFGSMANYDGGTDYGSLNQLYIFDVTDTSTHKFRFDAGGSNTSVNFRGGNEQTKFVAIRLGDT